jgi:hypothetical protein
MREEKERKREDKRREERREYGSILRGTCCGGRIGKVRLDRWDVPPSDPSASRLAD